MKKKLRVGKFLSKISITKKLIVIFLGGVIIPMVLQVLFYTNYTEKRIQEEIFQKMDNSLDNIANRAEAGFKEIITLATRYNNDVNIYQALDNSYSNDLSYFMTYQDYILDIFKADLPFYLQIDSIVLYSDNNSLFNGSVVRKLVPFSEDLTAVSLKRYEIDAVRNKEKNLSLGIGLEFSNTKMINQRQISIICEMERYPRYSGYKKILQIKLNPAYYNSILSNSSLFDNVLIADEEGNVLFSSNSFEQTGEYDNFDKNKLEKEFLVIEKQMSSVPLYLYGYYDSRMISDKFKDSIPGIILISLIGVAVALVSILTVGKNITKRTKKIVDKATKISTGSFINDAADEGEDELARIEHSIDKMSEQLTEYIENEYNAKLTQSRLERENTQAKLLALHSQVNPHFMFNALETIRLNALDKDKQETSKMIKYMSKMFRYLVDWDKDIICLKDEINFLYEFLSIQKYRFGDEFNYVINMEAGAEKCRLPKLTIQPLVENACVHGVEAVSNEKLIQIYISVDNGKLILEVKDNGGGINGERLSQLKIMLSGGSKVEGSVGIYNVYQRLSLYYKDGFEFTIDSVFGEGTVCRVVIPADYF